jgi:hypothetical protein
VDGMPVGQSVMYVCSRPSRQAFVALEKPNRGDCQSTLEIFRGSR